MSRRVSDVPPDPAASRVENDRQYRNIDLRITAHSIYRDSYESRSLLLKILLTATSALLCGFAFSGDKLFNAVGLPSATGEAVVGVISLIVMALSVTELLVKWDQKATLHGEAAKRLSKLKRKYRIAYTRHQGGNVTVNERLTSEWDRIHATLPDIPEKQFVKIKHKHHTKRQLSEFAEANKDIPYYLLFLVFNTRAWRKVRQGGVAPKAGITATPGSISSIEQSASSLPIDASPPPPPASQST